MVAGDAVEDDTCYADKCLLWQSVGIADGDGSEFD